LPCWASANATARAAACEVSGDVPVECCCGELPVDDGGEDRVEVAVECGGGVEIPVEDRVEDGSEVGRCCATSGGDGAGGQGWTAVPGGARVATCGRLAWLAPAWPARC